MRKKITLVLATMFVAMFLTACSTSITAEEYNDLKNVATELKNAEGEYQLPDGYTVEYTNPTKTNQITIIKKSSTGDGDNIKATFDVTKNEPELISLEQGLSNYALKVIFITFFITFVITVVLCAAISS